MEERAKDRPSISIWCAKQMEVHSRISGQTFLAVAVSLVFMIPALFIGWLISVFAFYFIEIILFDDNPLNIIFDGLIRDMMLEAIPVFLQGIAAGMLVIFVCARILKNANYNVVAISIASIFIIMCISLILYILSGGVSNMGALRIIFNTAGIVIGLFSASAIVKAG
tara:strand:+ start:25 stop:525 length:501 start_codon:yes stop_codon:yes gene_type:complete